jgi:hypothetical protein
MTKLIADLIGKSTVKRRNAANKLWKSKVLNDSDICKNLLTGLKLEEHTSYSKTKVALLRAIGKQKCGIAKDYIFEKYIKNRLDAATVASATSAYVRLKRKNLKDVSTILDLFKIDNVNVKIGALRPLGYDKMIPDLKYQEKIITECYSFGKGWEKEYSDPRYSLAAACAGWEVKIVRAFLEDCLKTDDIPLNYVAKNSIKKKYVKLRTLGQY